MLLSDANRPLLAKLSSIALFSMAVTILVSASVTALAMPPIEEGPIRYGERTVEDPVALLQREIDRGAVTLEHDEKFGYLVAMLKHLNVPVSSQTLVFSKTSLQNRYISPRTPRAIYFSDGVYMGWVQGSPVMEFAAVDPRQGAIFYTLNHQETAKPKFTRHSDRCLLCHASSQTQGVPGHLVRSVFPDRKGFPVLSSGTFRTDHRSPLKERWGGWYVTGTHGKQRHMGNALVLNKYDAEKLEDGSNVIDLSDKFDTSSYISGHSDIAALMVLEHQSRMHNLLTYANYQGRLALRDEEVINRMLKRPDDHRSPSTQRRFNNAAEKLLKYALFADEALLDEPLKGTTDFAKTFSALGPFDKKGRSLRALDLKRQLFKYPCSFLIYSKSFDSLPEPVLECFYRRLWEVLNDVDKSETYARLSSIDRETILEILRETKPGLPKYFQPGHAPPQPPATAAD